MRYSLCAYSAILVLLSGCGADRAVVMPWNYAPSSSYCFWNDKPTEKLAEKSAKKMQEKCPPEMPQQKEPITLGELVDVALRNNTQTRLTWANARQAAAQYAQSEQNFFPLATGSYNYQRQRSIGNVGFLNAGSSGTGSIQTNIGNTGNANPSTFFLSQWGPQLSISYLIFDFGQTRVSSESALMALYNANLTHNREIETVVQTITTDYYNYLYQKMLQESYEQDIVDAKVTLEATNVGLKAGVKNVSDYLQARSQLLQLETEWVNQQQTVNTAYAQLLTDMGLPATMQFKLQSMPIDPPVFQIMSSVNELIALALDVRSDLIAAEANLASKEKSLLAAKLNMLPNVTGTFDIGKTYFSGNINDGYDFAGQLSLSWPLFNGFYDMNAIRLAEAKKEQAQATLRQSELDVIEEITTAHFNVAIARDALKYTVQFLEAAQEQYNVAISQYKSGTADILTVTNAQSNLADARAKRANALQQWFVSLSTLGYSIGVMEQDLTPFMRGS